MKQTLILNSHSLSDYQQCEMRYLFSTLISLEPLTTKKVMDKGTFVHRWLRMFYYHKMKKEQGRVSNMRRNVLINAKTWVEAAYKRHNIPFAEAMDLYRALTSYSINYKNENWKTEGTEVGFSKVLFEDENSLVTWEGRVDWIGTAGNEKLLADHKTRSGKTDIYEFNNQTRGYLWAPGRDKFVYNFITLTKQPTFERKTISFTAEQIEEWKQDTIQWARRILDSVKSKRFLRSWQCQTKYGVCQYHSICECTSETQQLFQIKALFKQTPVRRSW